MKCQAKYGIAVPVYEFFAGIAKVFLLIFPNFSNLKYRNRFKSELRNAELTLPALCISAALFLEGMLYADAISIIMCFALLLISMIFFIGAYRNKRWSYYLGLFFIAPSMVFSLLTEIFAIYAGSDASAIVVAGIGLMFLMMFFTAILKSKSMLDEGGI